jgi:hypothetical protein
MPQIDNTVLAIHGGSRILASAARITEYYRVLASVAEARRLGTRYINGGVRSAENADLAVGYANVVVLSAFGGRTGTLSADQFEGIRRSPEWGTDLASQAEALRKQGSRDPPHVLLTISRRRPVLHRHL